MTSTKTKKSVRIGVHVVGDPSYGGVYQYELAILEALLDKSPDLSARFSFVLSYLQGDYLPLERLGGCGWSMHAFPSESMHKTLRLAARARTLNRTRARLRKARAGPAALTQDDDLRAAPRHLERFLIRQFFRRQGIDVLLCTNITSTSFEAGIPYIVAIHDLQHRLQPEFPEVSADGEWERREYAFRNAASGATLLIADSEIGKEDIVNCYGEYGVSPGTVCVLPFVPPPYLVEVPTSESELIRKAHGLPERFFFYPAQFWPHKNHARIVEAIGMLKRDHGLEIHIAFTGSPRAGVRDETASRIAELAANYGCSHQIHSLEYLGAREISALYGIAQGLVMPTFFGPTNIPILEAWVLNCPVLTSDIRGVREQVGDAGLLVDPTDVHAIADGMLRLATDETLRDDLRERGLARVALYTRDDFARRLTEILDEACELISTGNANGVPQEAI